jgi:hypothetical protein
MDKIVVNNIEDCVEILAGISQHNFKFKVIDSDSAIINSIARQVYKGVALTDRQYDLLKLKLPIYKEQFENYNIDLMSAISKLRLALRAVDRTKTITVAQDPNANFLQNCIKVKFPFSKSLIVKIESIAAKNKNCYYHSKGSHEHYFSLTEEFVFKVVDVFKNSNFIIDQELLDQYNEIKKIKEADALDYLPCYKNKEFYNLSKSAKEYLLDKEYSLLHLHDRKTRYGLYEVLPKLELYGLENDIVYRKLSTVFVDPEKYSVNEVGAVLNKLDRYPLLVILDPNTAFDQLEKIYTAFIETVSSSEQTVLVREETNVAASKFNQFVHDHKINNRLTSDTKIVYIFRNNFKKLLLKEQWYPSAVFQLGSDSTILSIATYIKEHADLEIYYDKEQLSLRTIIVNAL